MFSRWELRYASGFAGYRVELADDGSTDRSYGGGRVSDGKGGGISKGWDKSDKGGKDKSGSSSSNTKSDLDIAREMMGLNNSVIETPDSNGKFSKDTARRITENMRQSDSKYTDGDISDTLGRLGFDYGDRASLVGAIDALPGWGRKLANTGINIASGMVLGPVGSLVSGLVGGVTDMQQAVQSGVAPQLAFSRSITPALTGAISGRITGALMQGTPLGELSQKLATGAYNSLGGGQLGIVGGMAMASMTGGIVNSGVNAGLNAGLNKLANAAFNQNSSLSSAKGGTQVGRQPPDKNSPFHSIYAFDQQHHKGWGSYA